MMAMVRLFDLIRGHYVAPIDESSGRDDINFVNWLPRIGCSLLTLSSQSTYVVKVAQKAFFEFSLSDL